MYEIRNPSPAGPKFFESWVPTEDLPLRANLSMTLTYGAECTARRKWKGIGPGHSKHYHSEHPFGGARGLYNFLYLYRIGLQRPRGREVSITTFTHLPRSFLFFSEPLKGKTQGRVVTTSRGQVARLRNREVPRSRGLYNFLYLYRFSEVL